MTGNTSYFYVSVFHTLPGAANIATYSQTDNDFQYTSTAAYLLVAGSALVVTPLTMWCVPPQATHFRYWAEINATLAGRNALIGEATSWHILLDPTGMGYAGTRGEFGEFSLVGAGASTGVFKYTVSDAATVVTIQCTGFRM